MLEMTEAPLDLTTRRETTVTWWGETGRMELVVEGVWDRHERRVVDVDVIAVRRGLGRADLDPDPILEAEARAAGWTTQLEISMAKVATYGAWLEAAKEAVFDLFSEAA